MSQIPFRSDCHINSFVHSLVQAGDSPEMLEKDEYLFKLQHGQQMSCYDKRLTPFIELKPFPKEHSQQMEKLDMTSGDIWIPPPRLGLKKQMFHMWSNRL